MQYNFELQRPQNLTRIKSTAFDIYKVTIQGQQYFGYFPKEQYLRQQNLREYLDKDMQNQYDYKYLRKYISSASKGCFAFEAYNEYQLLADLKQVSEQVILKITQDILIALFAIHEKGLLGRCFNVNNIVFVENKYASMMEFGFYPNIEYKVPEIIYNQGQYTEKIDIFLLGRVMYHLMIGNDIPKFDINNLKEIQSDINLQIASTCYSENLKLLVISMLSIDVNRRINYLQIIQKFRNSYYYQSQNNFYSQPTLKMLTQQIIEKRENSPDLILQSNDAFTVDKTSNFEKFQQKEQTQQFQTGSIILKNEKFEETPTPIYEPNKPKPSLDLQQLYPPETQNNLLTGNDFQAIQQKPPIRKQSPIKQQVPIYQQPVNQVQYQTPNPNNQIYPNLISGVGDQQIPNYQNIPNQQNNSSQQNKPSQSNVTQIQHSLDTHDLYLGVLPYLNADRPNNFLIWNQIYFFLYRFSLMQKLMDLLKEYNNKQQNSFIVQIAIFALKKASIILKKEYYQFLEYGTNIYEISQIEWDKFIRTCDEYNRMVKKLKFDLELSIQQFKSQDYNLLKKTLDQSSQDSLMKELYCYTKDFLDDNLNYQDFEQIKRSYRYVLTNTLSLFDNHTDDCDISQIRLLILMCILINRICDRVHIPQHFKTVAKYQKLEQVSSIVEIELFLRNASKQDYQRQFDELKEEYFSVQ